jgi:hypothetical protein
VQIDWILDEEERGESMLSDEQLAELKMRLQDGDEFVSHEEVVAFFEEKYGR